MIAEPSQHETVATEYLQEAKIVPKTNLDAIQVSSFFDVYKKEDKTK